MSTKPSQPGIRQGSWEIREDETSTDGCVLFVVNAVRQNLKTPMSIDSMAEELQLSRSRLQHKFKSVLGLSIGRFRLHRRLHVAAVLLADTEASVKEIQFEVGFSDPSNFAHYFREHFGVSPNGFRQARRRDYPGVAQHDLPTVCSCRPSLLKLVSSKKLR